MAPGVDANQQVEPGDLHQPATDEAALMQMGR